MGATGEPPACGGGLRPIVVDAANVAMFHGKQTVFSCLGIELALRYWEKRGHPAVAVLPSYYLDYEQVGARRRLRALGGDVSTAKLPDDIARLERLVADGRLVVTPAHDYDDSYALHFARLHDGYVLSNDRYADFVDKAGMAGRSRRDAAAWVRAHVVSFAWFGDELMPNPEFQIVRPARQGS